MTVSSYGTYQIRPASLHDVPVLAELHKTWINKGFMSSLGLSFLNLLYRSMSRSRHAFCLVAVDEQGIAGFVSGTTSVKKFYFEFLIHNCFRAAAILGKHLITPSTLAKITETLLYPRKERDIPQAELLSIVVNKRSRGKGISSRLFEHLTNEFERRGAGEFKVVVGDNLVAACKFYEKENGYRLNDIEIHRGEKSRVYMWRLPGSRQAVSNEQTAEYRYAEKKRIFPFYKGRVALYAILKALTVQASDEIILPGFTCVVVPNAISYLGAKPVYVDIAPGSYNIDPGKIEEKITSRTRAIIVQHTFGIPAEMEAIGSLAEKHGIPIIEDSCHAIGSRYRGREVGTFGTAAFFSSQWSKPFTTGLGGWAVINDQNLAKQLADISPSFSSPSIRESVLLRAQYSVFNLVMRPSVFWLAQTGYRMLSSLGICIGSSSGEELDCGKPAGYEKAMSFWQRRLLAEKLKAIGKIITHRRWITSLYERLLQEHRVPLCPIPEDCELVFVRYPLLVKNKEAVLAEAKKNRIELGDWFLSPVHPNESGWKKAGYAPGSCPAAEAVCRQVINLPTHPRVSRPEAERIVAFINRYASF